VKNAKTKEQLAAEAKDRADKLALAFVRVFGADDVRRDAPQRMVWGYLEQLCYRRRPTIVPGADGNVDPLRMAAAEGHRDVLLQIEELLRHASEVEQPKPKPEVIR
jgi:hypothetical protein